MSGSPSLSEGTRRFNQIAPQPRQQPRSFRLRQRPFAHQVRPLLGSRIIELVADVVWCPRASACPGLQVADMYPYVYPDAASRLPSISNQS